MAGHNRPHPAALAGLSGDATYRLDVVDLSPAALAVVAADGRDGSGVVTVAILKRRGLQREQRALSAALRAAGASWVQIAAVFRDRYHLNARTALRVVRGWTQPQAAEQWNRRWPDEPKSLKNISYWENWPSRTGREPSLAVLARLAELYECAVTDVVTDLADYRHLDPAHRNPMVFGSSHAGRQPSPPSGPVDDGAPDSHRRLMTWSDMTTAREPFTPPTCARPGSGNAAATTRGHRTRRRR